MYQGYLYAADWGIGKECEGVEGIGMCFLCYFLFSSKEMNRGEEARYRVLLI